MSGAPLSQRCHGPEPRASSAAGGAGGRLGVRVFHPLARDNAPDPDLSAGQVTPRRKDETMLRKRQDMPHGTIGFEAVGDVEDDDYEEVLAPALRQWITERGKIRLLYLLGPRLREYEGDALAEEAKFVARHPTSYERIAVVSDEEWLRPALAALVRLQARRQRR